MLAPLDLNLATRPFRNNTLPWSAVVVVASAIVALTWWNVSTYLDYGSRLERLREELGSYDSRMANLDQRGLRADRGIRAHDLGSLSVQTMKANSVIALKAFSWTRLFNQLENVLPYEVRMSSIRPVFRIGATAAEDDNFSEGGVPVTVEGVAKTLEMFLELERNLLDDSHFDRVEPERHLPDENGEIVFKLRFRYYPEVDTGGEGAGETGEEAGEASETEPETAPDTPPEVVPSEGPDEIRAGAPGGVRKEGAS